MMNKHKVQILNIPNIVMSELYLIFLLSMLPERNINH